MNRIIIRLTGGLGNQMFQIALAKVFEAKYNCEILLDTDFFKENKKRPGHTPREFELQIFGINYPKATQEDKLHFSHLSYWNKIKRILNLNYPQIYGETSFNYNSEIEKIFPPLYLKGFFQSYKYFEKYDRYIRETFEFPESQLDLYNKKILKNIKNEHSVSVHIRRGDYIQDKGVNEVHGNCSSDYFIEALNSILNSKNISKVFFFSDDIEWVKQEFDGLPFSKEFIDHNNGRDSWKDLFLMSNCEHNVISNSSFSWWAAWLNLNPNKMVIAPKTWFAKSEKEKFTFDLIPPKWIRI